MYCRIATKKCGGNAVKVTSGKPLLIIEIMVAVAPNVPKQNAKRRTLDKRISVIVYTAFCTALMFVSIL